MSASLPQNNNDDQIILTSNIKYLIKTVATVLIANATLVLHAREAIPNSGATQISIMEGTPCAQQAMHKKLAHSSLADGRQVASTHMYEIFKYRASPSY
jgi:hypothetical protein